MTRRFAQDTTVPIHKTRAEVEAELRRIKVKEVQWTNGDGCFVIRFTLPPFDGVCAVVERTVMLETDAQLKNKSYTARYRRFSQTTYEKLKASNGMRQHRMLLLWVKAQVEMVLEGALDVREAMLAWVVTNDGGTIGQRALASWAHQDSSSLLPPSLNQKALGPGGGS